MHTLPPLQAGCILTKETPVASLASSFSARCFAFWRPISFLSYKGKEHMCSVPVINFTPKHMHHRGVDPHTSNCSFSLSCRSSASQSGGEGASGGGTEGSPQPACPGPLQSARTIPTSSIGLLACHIGPRVLCFAG